MAPIISTASAFGTRRQQCKIDIVSLLSVWTKTSLSPYRQNDSRHHETHKVVGGIDEPELLGLPGKGGRCVAGARGEAEPAQEADDRPVTRGYSTAGFCHCGVTPDVPENQREGYRDEEARDKRAHVQKRHVSSRRLRLHLLFRPPLKRYPALREESW